MKYQGTSKAYHRRYVPESRPSVGEYLYVSYATPGTFVGDTRGQIYVVVESNNIGRKANSGLRRV